MAGYSTTGTAGSLRGRTCSRRMPRLTQAPRAFSASGETVQLEMISRTSLAVRSEFAKVGNRAQDSASAACSTGLEYSEVFHQTKFMIFGSSHVAWRVRQMFTESMTSMVMTTVPAQSTDFSGTTSNPCLLYTSDAA